MSSPAPALPPLLSGCPGLMRLLPQCTPIPCPQAATTWYRSPELLLGSTSNSAAADMWRYGIEVHTGVWMSGDVWTVPSLRLPAAARMRRDGPQRCLHRDLALARNTQNILVPSSVPEAASSAIQSSDTVIRAWTECRSQTGNRALPPPPSADHCVQCGLHLLRDDHGQAALPGNAGRFH